ncbi:hypothetical protein AYO21_05878 [Fonsecaea monophora]|uniref:Uncharacterized protein n=1 Tax=Fonsecaea monophora TaxID=254056 RepID=A0A177F6J8_9EURO|nr:hypothetical protein AYO21_05878 [Fonsecaea monophora]OAG39813.1 hypothetical protein AYO21_05878 [Fonsecaea monophora]
MADDDIDDLDLLESAPGTLLAIARVSTTVGIKRLHQGLGNLGGELAALSEIIQRSESTLQGEKFKRRWHREEPSEDFIFLLRLSERSSSSSRVEADLEAGLLAYASAGKLPKLIALVKGFAGHQPQSATAEDSRQSFFGRRPGQLTMQEDYPNHVRQQLYQTLREHSRCVCVVETSESADAVPQNRRHLSRLRLRPSRNVNQTFIRYDMVFSSRPVLSSTLKRIDWQHMQFQVPSERLGREGAGISSRDSSLHHLPVEPRLCNYMISPKDYQICLQVHRNYLWLLYNRLPLEAHVTASPSLSLSDTLEIGRLSDKMKVILAYIIAISVWEFYNSDWMSRPWSADDIHFLQKQPGIDRSAPVIFVNKPYLAVQMEESDGHENDCSGIVGQIHQYPKILALGWLLIEIATGIRARDLSRNDEVNINSEWLSAQEFLSRGMPWDTFDYRKYWEAVRNCVSNQFITEGPASGISLVDIEDTRLMILEDVVRPLEDLLVGTGWIHDIWTVGSVKPLMAKPILAADALLAGNANGPRHNNTMQPQSNGIGAQSQTVAETIIPADVSVRSSTQSRPRTRQDFGIGIICALTIEADCIISLFDQHWDDDDHRYGKALKDPNAYTIGRIGHHNVVVVHMPSTGKVSAASVAWGLESSFCNIQLVLVVGICGGVPYYRHHGKREIFLGDVIISRSLIQYDFGRQYPTGFECKDCLEGGSGKPPVEIRSLLAKLETSHHRRRLERKVNRLLEALQARDERVAYPGAEADTLFACSSLHRHHEAGNCQTCQWAEPDGICRAAIKSSCEDLGCYSKGIVERTRSQSGTQPGRTAGERSSYRPAIHIGIMGSGDTVMKSGRHREKVALKYDVVGFEMEGAGIWDFFPSLVIKAVCDYADSHKNKKWQMYAAATAAAATKAFLEEWRPGSGPPVD